MIKKILWSLTFVCLAFFGCNEDENGSLPGAPTITGMTPAQAGNGDQNVQGIITGTNLSGATAVQFEGGITVHSFHSNSSTEIAVSFSISGAASAGPRTITVTTPGGTASSATVFQVVIGNKPPIAAFSVSPGKGNTTTTFAFDASRSRDPDGRIVEFRWEFGDGKRATGKKVLHTFSQAGNYAVSLKVEDNRGLQVTEKNTVRVEKNTAQVCTQKLPFKRVGIFGTVTAVNGNSYTFRTDDNHTCSTAFYKCGDFAPPAENTYYGTVCSLKYFGDRVFEVGVINAQARPSVGSRAFIKAQKCKFDPCH